MKDLYQCDMCGCTDKDACLECRKQSHIRKEHAQERGEGGYDE